MDTIALISTIALGGLLGVVGQGIRITVGLKKASDEAAQAGCSLKEVLDAGQLALGLLIGFVAGAMASILLDGGQAGAAATPPPAADAVQQRLLALVAAGYAGTDFIEGLVRKRFAVGSTAVAPQND